VAAMWLGGGAYGIHTFFKYRSYVDSLPPDPDNNALKNTKGSYSGRSRPSVSASGGRLVTGSPVSSCTSRDLNSN